MMSRAERGIGIGTPPHLTSHRHRHTPTPDVSSASAHPHTWRLFVSKAALWKKARPVSCNCAVRLQGTLSLTHPNAPSSFMHISWWCLDVLDVVREQDPTCLCGTTPHPWFYICCQKKPPGCRSGHESRTIRAPWHLGHLRQRGLNEGTSKCWSEFGRNTYSVPDRGLKIIPGMSLQLQGRGAFEVLKWAREQDLHCTAVFMGMMW